MPVEGRNRRNISSTRWSQRDDGLIEEAADLPFNLMVLLRARGLSFDGVTERLAARRASERS